MKPRRGLSLSLILSIFLAGCATVPERAAHDFNEREVLAEFTIARGEDFICLPVDFRGEQHLFILDTGCSWVTFDTSFRDLLGDARRSEMVNTHACPIMVEVFDASEAYLGPLSMGDVDEVICTDLKWASLVLEKKISGLIGMNFLRRYIMQIDYDQGKVTFLRRMKGAQVDWGERLPITYNSGGIPQIRGHVPNGGKTWFMIDTGAAITKCLESKVFKNVLRHRAAKPAFEGWLQIILGSTQNEQNEDIRIDELSLGVLKYTSLIFRERKVSFLGNSFLSRHMVTFDFPNNAMYLKKGKAFERSDEADMSGLYLTRASGRTVVHSVDEGGPAQKAGIQVNDIVLKVNGKDADAYSRWELSRLKKSGDKQRIKMTIKRGNDIQEISFLLKQRI